MGHWIAGFKDFYQKYKAAWLHCWRLRDQLDPPVRSGDELAFLPAHLELVETPVSPVPRWSMRVIILFAFIALMWALFGHLDIVAVAGGKTVTGGRTKVIQPLEPSVVKSIRVKDGQHVKAGQLLIELDATMANADYRKAAESLETARLAEARYTALLTSLETGKLPTIGNVEGIDETQRQAEEAVTLGQYRAYITRYDTQRALVGQREAELATVRQQISKLTSTSKIAADRAADFQRLLDQNFISKHAWLEKEQERIELQSDLAAQRSRLNELQAALSSQRQELEAIRAEFRRDALDKQHQAREAITQHNEESKKTGQREALMRLTAPVDGTVQQLAVHTVGGVVTEAQPLLAIAPANESMEVEAMIENKDIGFVKVGQDAVVKIESFPYTRYGHIEGKVENVSHDAMQDEKRGLIYPARIRLSKTFLIIDGTRVNLTAGMAVSAEIKTGKRRVIDYFLSPLRVHTGEGLRER